MIKPYERVYGMIKVLLMTLPTILHPPSWFHSSEVSVVTNFLYMIPEIFCAYKNLFI